MSDTLMGRRKRGPTSSKAKEMLRHGSVRGHELSEKQKGYFGLIAGGGTPTKSRFNKRRKLGKA